MKAPVFRVFEVSGMTIVCDGRIHKTIKPVNVRGQALAQFSDVIEHCVRNDPRLYLREYASCKNARRITQVGQALLDAFGCAVLPEKHLFVLEESEVISGSLRQRHSYEVLKAGTVVYKDWLAKSFHLAPGDTVIVMQTVECDHPFDRQVRITNEDGRPTAKDLDVDSRKDFREQHRQALIELGVCDGCIPQLFKAVTVTHSIEVAKWIAKEIDSLQRKGLPNPIRNLLYAINSASSACYPEDELRKHDIWLPFMRVDIKRALAGAKVILSSGGIRKKEGPKCA